MQKIKLGVIIAHRDVFSEELAIAGRTEIIQALQRCQVEYVLLEKNEVGPGIVSNLQQAKACADLFRTHRDELDGILVSLPNFGDERSVAEAIKMSGLNVPVFIQAFSDKPDQFDLAHRRDSFCGKISISNVLKQYKIPFTIGQMFTTLPEEDEFTRDLEQFLKICRVVKGLRHVRIGLIGARVAPFKTVRFSEKILEANSISVETLDLSELEQIITHIDKKAVTNWAQKLDAYVPNRDPLPQHTLENLAKIGAALELWMRENMLHAFAFQCWPALQKMFGIFPCTLMSYLSQHLIPGACETDAVGALSMLALQFASGGPAGIFDWNNNWMPDPNQLVLFHCSNSPAGLLEDPKVTYNAMAVKGEGLDNSFATIYGRLVKSDITFCRIHTNDEVGKIESIVGQGKIVSNPPGSFGAIGVLEVPELQALLRYICYHGYEHHVSITQGNQANALHEAFDKYLKWDVYLH
ncbi:hypothetical protein U27_04636 [Candidatus Vecturithrix granuli]|uniref:L-fucose isomerase C-terminal domain-containing protein n=1 Tax=Vecturithrix granuli TaxID=1499967 RepID=A0A081BZB4_VECG1|nr:hypothetical protein U27_04636 [Candidatus Vecturithrix granuli]